jgi:Asp-tRNA(Asn)/Glu-tRNA(Gln) amidotransferase B subunit
LEFALSETVLSPSWQTARAFQRKSYFTLTMPDGFHAYATKSPAEQHGSDQASEHNKGGESGIHCEFINA